MYSVIADEHDDQARRIAFFEISCPHVGPMSSTFTSV